MTITVYGLVDPRTPTDVRYVGQTSDPQRRHLQHCTSKYRRTVKEEWIQSLKEAGFLPQMVTLETVDVALANETEAKWQKHHASTLLNDTISGFNRQIRDPIKRFSPFKTARAEAEKAQIIQAIKEANGIVTHASNALGISRPTLYERMAQLGLDHKQFKRPGYRPVVSRTPIDY